LKLLVLKIALFLTMLSASGQINKSKYLLAVGIEYRQLPIDIENLPANGSSSGNDIFYGLDFWRCLSLKSSIGTNLKNDWRLSIINYIRYNHLHWLELPEDGIAELQNLDEKKNLKFDLFLTFEKRKQLKKDKENYILASAGVGLSNINTRYNVYFKDTLPSGTIYEERFRGTFLRFTPRFGFGIQLQHVMLSLNAIIIEGPDLNDLTSLWMGGNISYEIQFKKKQKKQIFE